MRPLRCMTSVYYQSVIKHCNKFCNANKNGTDVESSQLHSVRYLAINATWLRLGHLHISWLVAVSGTNLCTRGRWRNPVLTYALVAVPGAYLCTRRGWQPVGSPRHRCTHMTPRCWCTCHVNTCWPSRCTHLYLTKHSAIIKQ